MTRQAPCDRVVNKSERSRNERHSAKRYRYDVSPRFVVVLTFAIPRRAPIECRGTAGATLGWHCAPLTGPGSDDLTQVERRLAAIMLADVAGYSALMERDESGTFERVREMRERLVAPTVARYGGRIIKTTGDGFLAEFSSGTAALICGIDIQRLNHSREATRPKPERIQLRIGINLGDIIIDGDDVSGDGVNVAARLEPLAPVDGICMSGAVRDQIREKLDVVFEDIGEQHVKNISRPIRAYRINLTGTPAGNTRVSRGLGRAIAIPVVVMGVVLGGGYYSWKHSGSILPGAPAQTEGASQPGEFAGIRIESALVIGNSKYANLSVLPNAGNDAIAISTALKLKAIPVTLRTDLSYADTVREIADFRKAGDENAVKLFFYSGHGWNIGGKNYLFPVDAPSEGVLREGKRLDMVYPVTDIYHRSRSRMIVLLDTHGDDVTVPENIVLTFSGSPRHQAQDNYVLPDGTSSRNSPYAASLIEMLAAPTENLPTAFLELGKRVEQKTGGKQIPWISTSIVGAGSWTPPRPRGSQVPAAVAEPGNAHQR